MSIPGLTERKLRCPCCKRTFVCHVDTLRYVYIESRPELWSAGHFDGSRHGGAKRSSGADILRDKKENTIPRNPDQARPPPPGSPGAYDRRDSDSPDAGIRDAAEEISDEDE